MDTIDIEHEMSWQCAEGCVEEVLTNSLAIYGLLEFCSFSGAGATRRRLEPDRSIWSWVLFCVLGCRLCWSYQQAQWRQTVCFSVATQENFGCKSWFQIHQQYESLRQIYVIEIDPNGWGWVLFAISRYIWESKADGKFAVIEDTENEPLGRGTEIRIHLKKDASELYAEETKLRVRTYLVSQGCQFGPSYIYHMHVLR